MRGTRRWIICLRDAHSRSVKEQMYKPAFWGSSSCPPTVVLVEVDHDTRTGRVVFTHNKGLTESA